MKSPIGLSIRVNEVLNNWKTACSIGEAFITSSDIFLTSANIPVTPTAIPASFEMFLTISVLDPLPVDWEPPDLIPAIAPSFFSRSRIAESSIASFSVIVDVC